MEHFTFQLSEFEGPLDLLLHLIAKNKMKIADIEIVSLIDQYLAIVNGPQGASLDAASEFIEMAARLIYMKSVFLLPRSEEQDQLREELTGQLVEYSICKQVAAQLGSRAAQIDRFVRSPMELKAAEEPVYAILHQPGQLLAAYRGLQGGSRQRPQPSREGFEPLVTAPFVSVASRVVYVLRRLVRGSVGGLSALFSRRAGRSENVATFLAVLELLKAGRIRLDGEAHITLQKQGRAGGKDGSQAI